MAAGSQPNFFDTPGAADHAFPLYSLDHATNLRSRILGLFEQVDSNPRLIQRGALNFVIVGGGPTGVEVAGAIADMVKVTVPAVYHDLDASAAQIHLLDFGDALLKPFSDRPTPTSRRFSRTRGCRSTSAPESRRSPAVTRCSRTAPHFRLAASSGAGASRRPPSRPTVAWLRAGEVVWTWTQISRSPATTASMSSGTSPTSRRGTTARCPQLGSVALQSGAWAAKNILSDLAGKPREPFAYHDKGIMAMIGRGAAIAEVGKRHHEIHGQMAHMAWLGVHASLMTGTKAKIETFVDWAWDGFSKTGGPHVLDRGDAAVIDWDDDAVVAPPGTSTTDP